MVAVREDGDRCNLAGVAIKAATKRRKRQRGEKDAAKTRRMDKTMEERRRGGRGE